MRRMMIPRFLTVLYWFFLLGSASFLVGALLAWDNEGARLGYIALGMAWAVQGQVVLFIRQGRDE
jgi:membrane protein required for beta-lactamase induction